MSDQYLQGLPKPGPSPPGGHDRCTSPELKAWNTGARGRNTSTVTGPQGVAPEGADDPASQPPESATAGDATFLVGPISSVTQSNVFESGQNYLTAVAAFDAMGDAGTSSVTTGRNPPRR